MSVNVRVRNGITPDGYTGDGGVTEGDFRGHESDLIDNEGVVNLADGHCLTHEASSPAMSVVVDAGVAYVPNTSFDETDSDSIKFWEAVVAGTTLSRTLTIGANSSGQTRIDLVCLYLDPGAEPDENGSDICELLIVAGTPGAGVPDTPSFHLTLAQVTVANGATSIVNANIADVRDQIKVNRDFLPTSKRVTSITSSSTPTPNWDTDDILVVTAQGATATFGAPTGTPTSGQPILIRIKDDGTARALNWNAVYRAVGTYLPSTTVIGKTLYVGGLWNATDSKVDVIATIQE